MKNITWLISIFFAAHLNAQITVNSTDFVSSADTVLISSVTDFQNINYQNTGSNYNWDFSWVMIDTQRIDTFNSVSSAAFIYQLVFNNFLSPSYQASYYQKADAGLIPTGGLPIAVENPIAFEKVSNSKFERVGLGVELNGVSVPITADTIDVVYEFPMTFQDSWVSNSYLFFDLNPAFAAMFKRHQNRTSTVDGYGSIVTTFGTFDCIRVKSELTYKDSLFFDFTGTGGMWIPMPSQPETEYRWIAKNQKIPVFSINVTNALSGPVITKVEFRDSYGVASIPTKDFIEVSIFPNPASNHINFSGIKNCEQVIISNVNGELIFSNVLDKQDNFQINTSSWSKGVYFIHLVNDEKTETKKIIIQ